MDGNISRRKDRPGGPTWADAVQYDRLTASSASQQQHENRGKAISGGMC